MDFLNGGFQLFTFRGVVFRVTWAFFITAVLIASFVKGVQDQVCIVIVLVFSIILHEFGHVIGGWITKADVTEVALTGLGGYTRMSPAQKPLDMFIQIVLGPLMNVLLVIIGVTFERQILPHFPPGQGASYAATLASFTIIMNTLLFLFNMLPVYPLDGGRIAQAIVWPFIGYAPSVVFAGMFGTVGGIALAGLGLGIAEIHIPVPFFVQDWTGIQNLSLGGAGNQDIFLIIIGATGALQSFALYQYGQSLVNARKR